MMTALTFSWYAFCGMHACIGHEFAKLVRLLLKSFTSICTKLKGKNAFELRNSWI